MENIDEIARENWEKALGCEVSDETNFFEFGGDSISAIMLISEINQALGLSLSPDVLFEAADFGDFRRLLENEQAPQAQGPVSRDTGEPAAGDGSRRSVTSALQERWFRLAKEQLGNVDVFFEVTGSLDPELFDAALTELCRRHTVLHSLYEPGNPPLQRSLPGWRPRPRMQNLEGRAEAEVRAAIHAAVERSARFFDLESEVPFELELLTLSPTEHLLIGHLHHIATDGWSIALLIDDLEEIYHTLEQGADPAALEPAVQYEAFAFKQRAYLAGPDIDAARAHWRSVFRGVAGPSEFPATMPPSSTGGPGASSRYVNLLLDRDAADAVRGYAQTSRVTVYNVLLSAFAQLLADISGADDLLVGTSTAGRQGEEDGECLGVFIGPMPIRFQLAEADSPQRLHALINDRMRDLAKHRMYPFADLIESVEPFKGRTPADVFSIHFIYQNQPQPQAGHGRHYRQLDFQDAGMARPHGLPMPRSRVLRQLEVIVFDRPDGSLSVNFAFDPMRLNDAEVSGWLDAYGTKVTALVGGVPAARD